MTRFRHTHVLTSVWWRVQARHRFHVSTFPQKLGAGPTPQGSMPRSTGDNVAMEDSVHATTIESSASICSTSVVNPAYSSATPPVTGSASSSNPTNTVAAAAAMAPQPANVYVSGSAPSSNPRDAATSSNPHNAATSSNPSNPLNSAVGCTGTESQPTPPSSGTESAVAPASAPPAAPHTAPLLFHLPRPPSFQSLSSVALAAAGPDSADAAAATGFFPVLQKFSSVATYQSSTHNSVEETPPPPPALQRRPPPPPGASLSERMEYTQFQLDTLDGLEVLDGLILQCGHSGRLRGGTAQAPSHCRLPHDLPTFSLLEQFPTHMAHHLTSVPAEPPSS